MAPLETTERNMHVRPREPPTSAQCPGDRREHVYVQVHACVLRLMPKANKSFLGEFRLLLFHCDGHRCLGYLLEATRRIWPRTSLEMWVGVLCAWRRAKLFTSTLIYSIQRPCQLTPNLFPWLGTWPQRAELGLDPSHPFGESSTDLCMITAQQHGWLHWQNQEQAKTLVPSRLSSIPEAIAHQWSNELCLETQITPQTWPLCIPPALDRGEKGNPAVATRVSWEAASSLLCMHGS